MKNLIRAILIVIAFALSPGSTLSAGENRYAASAYSPSTGHHGYGNGYSTGDEAIEPALQECGARDARAT